MEGVAGQLMGLCSASFNSEELLTLVVFFVKHCSHPNDDVSIQNPSKKLRRMPFI